MRISDWSSDVCSSDLSALCQRTRTAARTGRVLRCGFGLESRRLNAASGIVDMGKGRLEAWTTLGTAAAMLALAGCAHNSPYEPRSEEHTSELQSLMRISYAAFCLKKNKKNIT